MIIHTTPKKYPCKYCHIRFRTKRQYRHHQKIHVDYFCLTCQKQFPSAYTLKVKQLLLATHYSEIYFIQNDFVIRRFIIECILDLASNCMDALSVIIILQKDLLIIIICKEDTVTHILKALKTMKRLNRHFSFDRLVKKGSEKNCKIY